MWCTAVRTPSWTCGVPVVPIEPMRTCTAMANACVCDLFEHLSASLEAFTTSWGLVDPPSVVHVVLVMAHLLVKSLEYGSCPCHQALMGSWFMPCRSSSTLLQKSAPAVLQLANLNGWVLQAIIMPMTVETTCRKRVSCATCIPPVPLQDGISCKRD